jgi:NADH dehydrogenase [ubiquinone] 1 alpha subcomplex assembly factor 6
LYLLLQAAEASSIADAAEFLGKTGEILPHSTLFEHLGHEHDQAVEDQARTGLGNKTKSPDSLTLDHAASHLAVAMTIAILLRSIPHHAAKRINVIPTVIGELCSLNVGCCLPTPRSLFAGSASRHGLSEEALFRQGPTAPGLRESVATLVGIAEAELRTARECFDGTTGVPGSVSSVFATGVGHSFNCSPFSSSFVIPQQVKSRHVLHAPEDPRFSAPFLIKCSFSPISISALTFS